MSSQPHTSAVRFWYEDNDISSTTVLLESIPLEQLQMEKSQTFSQTWVYLNKGLKPIMYPVENGRVFKTDTFCLTQINLNQLIKNMTEINLKSIIHLLKLGLLFLYCTWQKYVHIKSFCLKSVMGSCWPDIDENENYNLQILHSTII